MGYYVITSFTPQIKPFSHATYVSHVILTRCAAASKVWLQLPMECCTPSLWNPDNYTTTLQIILVCYKL